jgi:hypothetical protein
MDGAVDAGAKAARRGDEDRKRLFAQRGEGGSVHGGV